MAQGSCGSRSRRAAHSLDRRGCEARPGSGVSRRQSQAGGGASPWRAGGRDAARRVRSHRAPAAGARRGGRCRRAGLRARGGGADCGGAAGAGRAASPEAEGAEPRSQLPPGRPAQAEDAARGRARTARGRCEQCCEAPGRAAERGATDGEARAAQPRGEPRRCLRIRPLFVWQTWPRRGALQGRCGRRARELQSRPGAGRPASARGRARGGAPSGEHRAAQGVFRVHARTALFKAGKLSFEFREGDRLC